MTAPSPFTFSPPPTFNRAELQTKVQRAIDTLTYTGQDVEVMIAPRCTEASWAIVSELKAAIEAQAHCHAWPTGPQRAGECCITIRRR